MMVGVGVCVAVGMGVAVGVRVGVGVAVGGTAVGTASVMGCEPLQAAITATDRISRLALRNRAPRLKITFSDSRINNTPYRSLSLPCTLL
jgi:hypothetical protein